MLKPQIHLFSNTVQNAFQLHISRYFRPAKAVQDELTQTANGGA